MLIALRCSEVDDIFKASPRNWDGDDLEADSDILDVLLKELQDVEDDTLTPRQCLSRHVNRQPMSNTA